MAGLQARLDALKTKHGDGHAAALHRRGGAGATGAGAKQQLPLPADDCTGGSSGDSAAAAAASSGGKENDRLRWKAEGLKHRRAQGGKPQPAADAAATTLAGTRSNLERAQAMKAQRTRSDAPHRRAAGGGSSGGSSSASSAASASAPAATAAVAGQVPAPVGGVVASRHRQQGTKPIWKASSDERADASSSSSSSSSASSSRCSSAEVAGAATAGSTDKQHAPWKGRRRGNGGGAGGPSPAAQPDGGQQHQQQSGARAEPAPEPESQPPPPSQGVVAEAGAGVGKAGTDEQLARLLGEAGVPSKEPQFTAQGITVEGLLRADAADLRELFRQPALGLNLGERLALQTALRGMQPPPPPPPPPLLESAGGGGAGHGVLEQEEAEEEEEALGLQQTWKVDFDDIQYDPVSGYLSKGVTGSVFRAQWNQQHVAVKIFNCQGGDESAHRAFRKEVNLLRHLNHDNLVRFYAACDKPPPDGQLCIVMELMKGSLASLLYGKGAVAANGKYKQEMTDNRLLAIAYGIVKGMCYLHKNHVCHRDLKSHNVLYDQQLRVKLCDFAFSKFKVELEKKSVRFESRVGTPQWMAPEVLRGEDYTFSADVYSMGVIVWEMLARQQPFADIHQMAVMYKVGSEGLRLCPPAGCPPFWRGLMEACWRPAPTRPSFMHIAQQLRAVHKEMQAGGGSASFAAGIGASLFPTAAAAAAEEEQGGQGAAPTGSEGGGGGGDGGTTGSSSVDSTSG